MAGTRPNSPVFRLPFWAFPHSPGEPALTSKCSQTRPNFPPFSPISRSKRPPTSLLGNDAHPCTRVIHHIRPQTSLRRPRKRLRRELGGPGQLLAPMQQGFAPTSPFFRLAFCQLPPSSGEPALTSKCSQPPLLLLALPPVSGRKSPPTCISATDAHPCTRVIHHIRPQTSLRRPRKRLRRELDGPANCLLRCGRRRAASRLSLGDFRPRRWNQPLQRGAKSHWQPLPQIACPMWQRLFPGP